MKNIFYRDSFLSGIILGTILPLILFGILYSLDILFSNIFSKYVLIITIPTLQLFAIVVNVFIMRHYLVKLKFDKTGRGLLIMTFVYILAYFVNEFLINKS